MRISSSCRNLLAFISVAAATHAFAADGYRIIQTYPHDPGAYTQGLVYVDGHLYESTGLNGRSSLRMDDLETGRVLQSAPLSDKYFGEGLAAWGSTLVQLTWQAKIAFVYDRFSFRLLRTFHYDGEGWGLTQNGRNLILSDGTATLRFFDPQTFREVRRIVVKDQGAPVTQLNELEYVRGEIYANVWHTDHIARISPATGSVLGWIDLTGLLPQDERSDPEAVLNGIAYDAAHDRLFVTGKLWPKLFEIKVVPEQAKLAPAHHAK
ncbi:Glutaminyl-peptide cyclotransferase family protein [Candidatus Sulfotelmatomonas gaucii]|uniref:Glutaminyl-peptide cyclotransferase family protein n=1 Tax=Candidatus Sulfuritelmatomonas gaucii TaxID=2043161 RepID=A0A2N9LCY3_9BACT|nr:Glutaminyl-peptide cyclotransferase family protein [Candidatus Sulfotelmatomonas gaucii]